MVKPNWKFAPESARWLAQDKDGQWYWYSAKPFVLIDYWGWPDGCMFYAGAYDDRDNPDWKETLEERP